MKKPRFLREKTVTTLDAWFMPGPSGVVHVTLSKRRSKGAPWRVSVWGPDDMGMGYETRDQDHAARLYDRIKDGVTKVSLLALGFADES